MTRKFKLVENLNDDSFIPKRSTEYAAGYDFKSRVDVVIQPLTKQYQTLLKQNENINIDDVNVSLIPTGVSVEMPHDNTLILANRSSNGTKRKLMFVNGIGIVDADYTDEIMIPFVNFGNQPYHIKKGDRIAQGIFTNYLLTDDDVTTIKRSGGFGSTGE